MTTATIIAAASALAGAAIGIWVLKCLSDLRTIANRQRDLLAQIEANTRD